ncbi:hypothetical protein LZ32DRAFT_260089 [Colletotrichum eremochloae]|nr:hypothetical protein LZ32DRAFT_260089 [Colletotrichum eremochloae]
MTAMANPVPSRYLGFICCGDPMSAFGRQTGITPGPARRLIEGSENPGAFAVFPGAAHFPYDKRQASPSTVPKGFQACTFVHQGWIRSP